MSNAAGKMITAVILAAGASGRMGKQKALLTISGKSFIQHLVDVFLSSAVAKTIVVVGADADRIERQLAGSGVEIAFNENYAQAQLSSIVTGLKAAHAYHPDAVLFHPVDHPLIATALINTLVATFIEKSPTILLPTFNGRRGHPVLFSASLFAELKTASPDIGARSVVWSHAAEVLEVETNEEGIILDIDTPEDYEHLRRMMHEGPNTSQK